MGESTEREVLICITIVSKHKSGHKEQRYLLFHGVAAVSEELDNELA